MSGPVTETLLLGLLAMGSAEDSPGRYEVLHELFMRTSGEPWRTWKLDREIAELMERMHHQREMWLAGVLFGGDPAVFTGLDWSAS